jgi:hypothetical protein
MDASNDVSDLSHYSHDSTGPLSTKLASLSNSTNRSLGSLTDEEFVVGHQDFVEDRCLDRRF